MKIAILRNHIKNHAVNLDALDNLEEANFAEQYLAKHHQIKQIAFVSDLHIVITELATFQPDVVFNLVETVCNSDALSIIAVQLLEYLRIPYTGNRMMAQTITANKTLTKKFLQRYRIPTPSSKFISNTDYIIKANTEHSSIGLDNSCIARFKSANDLKQALKKKVEATGIQEWMAEQYIEGREFNCAFIANEILPPAEMCFDKEFIGHKILTYEAKWDEKADSYRQSKRSFEIAPSLKQRLIELTLLCQKKLKLKGYARVDFRMDANENLYVIDINTNPCISPDSGFVAMVEQHALSIEEMFNKIM
ncbi:MAG: ATP-grasp domain-containing protein, partial [Bacteroidales bacterium]